MSYEYEKYICTIGNVKDTIQKYGVAIIPNLLDNLECEQIVNGIWNYLEHITIKWKQPLNRKEPNSWVQFYQLLPTRSMILQHWGVGHAQVSWNIRQNLKIIEVFAQIWNCKIEDLLVSFDGFSFSLPPEITNKGWDIGNSWFHIDQSYQNNDFSSIQSFITALDIREGDATLSFLEGSNHYHAEFKNHFNITEKSNWYKLNNIEQQFYLDKGCQIKNISCPKGSLVLWDKLFIMECNHK